jgi:hypothetical protein
MAPVIRISDTTYAKLGLLAEPFVDTTPDLVISRCLDEVLAARGVSLGLEADSVGEVRRLDPDNPDDLRHTTVKSVRVNGREIRPANWNAMLRNVHMRARTSLGSFQELRDASRSHLREGRYQDDGFYYVASGEFSIQGQDANLCWANGLHLAKQIGVPLEVTFIWQNREGAVHPGQRGVLEWAPTGA